MDIEAVSNFNDVCEIMDYSIINYKKDNGKKLNKIKNLLQKHNIIDDYFLNRYTLYFEYAPLNISAYAYNNEIYIFNKNNIMIENRSRDMLQIDSNYLYIINEVDNKELSDIYIVAKAFVTYKVNKCEIRLNPEDGKYYDSDENVRGEITYEDIDSRIIKFAFNRYYLIKKYNYYILANFEERREIDDRIKVLNALNNNDD